MIEIQKVKSVTFTVQAELLNLLHHAFAYMEGRIDPPSSLHRLNGEALQRKIAEEDLFIAVDGGRLIGCVFAKINIDHIYLCLLYTSPSPRDQRGSRMPSSA